MVILGIETSCNETSAAIIAGDNNKVHLLANTTSSSLDLHSKTGGIIPEQAAREQLRYMLPVLTQTLDEAKIAIKDIDALAITYGPGLIGSLLVGVETIKTIGYVLQKPIIPVNHMVGHIYANWIDNKNNIVTNGGRVLAVSSYGNTKEEALERSNANAAKINFNGKYFRTDIGFDIK